MSTAVMIAWWFLALTPVDSGSAIQQFGPFETRAHCDDKQQWLKNGGRTNAQVKADQDRAAAEQRAWAAKWCKPNKAGGQDCRDNMGTVATYSDTGSIESTSSNLGLLGVD